MGCVLVACAAMTAAPAQAAESKAVLDKDNAPVPGPARVLIVSPGIDVRAGTHNSGAAATISLEGLVESQRGWQAGIVSTFTGAAVGRMWGHSLGGMQLDYSVAGLLGHRYFSIGTGINGYVNRSGAELRGEPAFGSSRLSLLDQRVGHVFLQSQFGPQADRRRHTLRLSVRNDILLPWLLLFGDDGDSFRTADLELMYVNRTGFVIPHVAAGISLRTGLIDHDKINPADPRYLDTSTQPFREVSQGLAYIRSGVALRIHNRRWGSGELGFVLGLGVDAEAIRDGIQNGFHDAVGDKRVPLVERPPQAQFDIGIAYRFAFDLNAPPGPGNTRGHAPSPTRMVIAGVRP